MTRVKGWRLYLANLLISDLVEQRKLAERALRTEVENDVINEMRSQLADRMDEIDRKHRSLASKEKVDVMQTWLDDRPYEDPDLTR